MFYNVSVRIDDSDFQRKFATLLQKIPEEMQDNLTAQLAEETVEVMRSQAPDGKPSREVGHVKIRDSIIKAKWGNGWMVYPTARHSAYPNYGVAPHVITPLTAPYLYFYWEKLGRWVKLSQVNHPGQVRNPYIARTYSIMYERAKQLVQEYWDRVKGAIA